jgi:hypothetical protein
MAYQLDVKKLFRDLRGPKGVAALTEEIAKVSGEVEKLRAKVQPTAEAQIKKARGTIDELQKILKKAQVELDKELKKTIIIVKKYGEQAEKKFSKMTSGVTKTTKKAKTSKKTASKPATSKKKTSKKS